MIPITYTGTTQLCASNCRFKLSHTLYDSAIKGNLISISKFCHDNLASIEFCPTKFFVKDLNMGALLMCDRNKDGLYEWPCGQNSSHLCPQSHLVVT